MPDHKLLIIHHGALGDFILTFPALIGLKNNYQSIDALCRKNLGDLAVRLNLISRVYDLESAAFASLYDDHPKRIDARAADVLRAYERIILFSFSRPLQENIQHITGLKVLRVPPRPPAVQKTHVGAFIIEHLINAGLLAAGAASSLAANNVNTRTSRILIHPGSGSRKKNWPLANFIRLAEILCPKGRLVEFILGPAEFHLENKVISALGADTPLHIVRDLLQVCELLKTCGGFIGNDSGLCHLAAFMGLPTVAVFGPSDPVRWKPMGRAVAVVNSTSDCSPCHETDKNNCESLQCLQDITPEMVRAAFFNLNKQPPR